MNPYHMVRVVTRMGGSYIVTSIAAAILTERNAIVAQSASRRKHPTHFVCACPGLVIRPVREKTCPLCGR